MIKWSVLYDNNKTKYIIFALMALCIIGIIFASMQLDTAKKVDKKKTTNKMTKNPTPPAKKPTITMAAKPSCRSCCKQSYRWRTKTFVNYCPHCHKYGTLRKNPKGVYEKEYTCGRCDADFCANCGHDKHSNRRIHRNYVLSKP